MPHSLQCPRCQRSVQVADNASGTRVQCPHCSQPFLVPGFATSTNDDDDWLQLDDPPPPVKPVATKPPTGNAAIPKSDSATPISPPKVRPTSTFPDANQPPSEEFFSSGGEHLGDDGLPPFEMLPPVSRPPTTSAPGDFTALDDLGDSPPLPRVRPQDDIASQLGKNLPGTKPPTPSNDQDFGGFDTPANTPPEYAKEYRVTCLRCGTMTYAKASQAGSTIKCSDCHSPIKVPPPPRLPKKVVIDMENAPTFQFGDSGAKDRPADPFLKSAEELLRNAEKQNEEEPEPDYDVPSIREWARNVFGIFRDPGVVAHWLILSVFASIPAFIALALESRILMLGLFPGGIVFGVIVLVCGLAILQSVANSEERVSEWPAFDPAEWFGQLFAVSTAIGIAAVPAYAAAYMAFGQNLASVAITMVAIYAAFPFLLLSILDMQSVATPFSPEVARSITRCEESWGGFYFSSGVLFVVLFLAFVMTSSFAVPVRGVACIFLGVAACFIYFAMIGRLAYAIGQAVNAKPMVNDIDRSKKSE